MSRWRYTRWSWRHPILSRLLPRRLRARLIWREAMTDGPFLRSLDEGIADIEAGRVWKWSEIRRPVNPERRERIDAIKERMADIEEVGL